MVDIENEKEQSNGISACQKFDRIEEVLKYKPLGLKRKNKQRSKIPQAKIKCNAG
jgi:hypothetical protein